MPFHPYKSNIQLYGAREECTLQNTGHTCERTPQSTTVPSHRYLAEGPRGPRVPLGQARAEALPLTWPQRPMPGSLQPHSRAGLWPGPVAWLCMGVTVRKSLHPDGVLMLFPTKGLRGHTR